MEIQLPDYVQGILDTLNEFDHAAYIVGGCVRDALLGIEPHDWDICTDATPDQLKNYFADVIPIGEKYGTVMVGWHREDGCEDHYCEITTFRFDSNYSDGRRPDKVTFGTSILEDLARRDFTINAMAYNPLVGLVDPYKGQEDLKNGIIRAVGDAQTRIKEDALRILRGIRFAAKYNFSLENCTGNIISECASSLINVSNERIHEELIKILTHSKGNQKLLNECIQVLTYIFEIEDKNISKWLDNKWLYRLETDNSYLYKVWSLLTDYKNLYEMEIWLRKYKFSNDEIKSILNLEKIKNFLNSEPSPMVVYEYNHMLRILLSKIPADDLIMYYYENKKIIKDIYANAQLPHKISHLAIDGDDLILYVLKNTTLFSKKPQLSDRQKIPRLTAGGFAFCILRISRCS